RAPDDRPHTRVRPPVAPHVPAVPGSPPRAAHVPPRLHPAHELLTHALSMRRGPVTGHCRPGPRLAPPETQTIPFGRALSFAEVVPLMPRQVGRYAGPVVGAENPLRR